MDDTFKEMDEFQEDPPLFLEENSWEGEDSEFSDPTLTLLNHEHFQVCRIPVYAIQVILLRSVNSRNLMVKMQKRTVSLSFYEA